MFARVQVDFLADKLILDPLGRIDSRTLNFLPLICGKNITVVTITELSNHNLLSLNYIKLLKGVHLI